MAWFNGYKEERDGGIEGHASGFGMTSVKDVGMYIGSSVDF